MNALEDGDKLIKKYVRDSAQFIECFEYEDSEGSTYTLCCDQNGEEWIEE